MTRDHDPEPKKDKKDNDVGENGDHMTDFAPTSSFVLPSKEDKYSDKSNDADDSTRGPTAFEREKIDDISEDSKDHGNS